MERLLELEVLGRPHLVLADLGRDVDVAVTDQLVEPPDRMLGLDRLADLAEAQALLLPPLADLPPPGAETAAQDAVGPSTPSLEHGVENQLGVTDHGTVDAAHSC